MLEPFTHVPSALNPADLGNRGTVSLADLGLGSMWQCGPSFLTSPRDQWPLQEKPVIGAAEVESYCTSNSLVPTTMETPPHQPVTHLQLHLAGGKRLQ